MDTVAESVQKSEKHLESFNPSTGEKIGEVALSTPEDVARAAAKAREAQQSWAAVGVQERCRTLNRIRQVMLDRADEIGEVVSTENGKPRCEAVSMILPICEAIKFYTKIAKRVADGVKVKPTIIFLGCKAKIFYEPRGVAGFILPWNFPFGLGMKHMIPALAAGNACIQKPSEVTPLVGELIKSIYVQAGVPEDLIQIVHGYADVGEAVIDHSDVVVFVGSPAVGQKIMQRAAQNLIPVVLELGGKDPAIVRHDAHLDKAAQGLVYGACTNSGQVCNGVERIYAQESIADDLVEKIVEWTDKLRQNVEGSYDLGPLTYAPQLKIYERHLADAVQKGARVVSGGKVIHADGGLYWPPTVVTNVDHSMDLMKEETFGPFLPVMTFQDDEEAIRLANDSPFGLGASIWTRDIRAAESMARRLRTGSVVINNCVVQGGCMTIPFGGDGKSGVGRLQSEQSYYNFVAPKGYLQSASATKPEIMYMPYKDSSEAMLLGFATMLNADSVGKRIAGFRKFFKAMRAK